MFAFALAGLLPALVAGPGVAPGPPILTESDVLKALDADHPAVMERSQAVAVARARSLAASAFHDPVLEFLREDPDGPSRRTEHVLSWQLPGADRGPRIASRRREVDAAAARCSDSLAEVRRDLRSAYADWAVARARRDLLEAHGERLDALAERQARRQEQGEASGLEVHRLRAAARSLQTRADLASAEAARARAAVAAWVTDLPGDVSPELPSLPAAPEGVDQPPRVRAAEADLAAAELERRAAARFVASPELSLGRLQEEDGVASRDGLLVALSWTVPVFDRNRGRRAEAEARESAARARLEAVRRQVDGTRSGAEAAYGSLADAARQAADRLPEDHTLWTAAEAAFRLGELPMTDLLDVQRTVEQAELQALDLHRAALSALHETESLSGASVPCRSGLDVDHDVSRNQSSPDKEGVSP